MPEEPGRLTHLDHVIVGVRDLAAATGIQARLLGRSPSWRGEHPAAGTANTLFRLEDVYLELLAPQGEGPVGRVLADWLELHGEGPVGLAFRTDDAEACRAALAERGLVPGPVERGLGRDSDSGAFREWRRVPIAPQRTRGVLLFAVQHLSPPDVLPPAPPLGPEAGVVRGLDHAVVRTAQPEAARALYGRGLGLRLALDRRFDKWGVRLLFFRVGGVTVELAAALRRDGPLAAEPGHDRLWGLSWRVDDADAARERLAGAGLDVSPVRPGRKPGTRVLTVRDAPCGVATLLLEPRSRGPRANGAGA